MENRTQIQRRFDKTRNLDLLRQRAQTSVLAVCVLRLYQSFTCVLQQGSTTLTVNFILISSSRRLVIADIK